MRFMQTHPFKAMLSPYATNNETALENLFVLYIVFKAVMYIYKMSWINNLP